MIIYTFIKNGKTYITRAHNRIEAIEQIERVYNINLNGASWQQLYGLKINNYGIVNKDYRRITS